MLNAYCGTCGASMTGGLGHTCIFFQQGQRHYTPQYQPQYPPLDLVTELSSLRADVHALVAEVARLREVINGAKK